MEKEGCSHEVRNIDGIVDFVSTIVGGCVMCDIGTKETQNVDIQAVDKLLKDYIGKIRGEVIETLREYVAKNRDTTYMELLSVTLYLVSKSMLKLNTMDIVLERMEAPKDKKVYH